MPRPPSLTLTVLPLSGSPHSPWRLRPSHLRPGQHATPQARDDRRREASDCLWSS